MGVILYQLFLSFNTSELQDMGKNLQDEPQRCIFSLDFSSKTVTLKFSRTSSQQRLKCYLAGFYIYPVATPTSLYVLVQDVSIFIRSWAY